MKNKSHKQLTLLIFLLFILTSFTIEANNNNAIVKVKGSKAKGVYAHFKVFVNGLEYGDKYASLECKEYRFPIPFSTSEINEVKIVFDNDKYCFGEDRNLCIHSIIIGDEIPIKAGQETVKYVCMNGEEHPYCGMMQWNGTLTFDITKLRFHPGNVTLSSQSEVDAFSSQYVDGSLTISGSDITDLSPLASLASIKGALIIRDNSNLTTINGLNSIIEVSFLSIENNPSLTTIDGFHSLNDCKGMFIRNNESLKTIKCLNSPDI